jgi:hypothetical protein
VSKEIPVIVAAFVLAAIISCTAKMKEEIEKRKPINPPPVEVEATVDKAIATTGELINFSVTIMCDLQIDVQMPEPGAQIAGLRIVDLGEEGPKEVDNRRVLKKWYKLRADLVGSYIIPSFSVSYKDKQGNLKEIKTSQIFIKVKSVLKELKEGEVRDIIDIKSLQNMRRPLTPFILTGVALLALIGVGGFIFFFIRKRKKKIQGVLKPAHVIAFEELEKLKRDNLVEKGVVKEHYFRLSDIFRRYLERRFNVPAIERTTEELVPEIGNLEGLGTSLKSETQYFLGHADLVKFANYSPQKIEIDEGYQKVVRVIRETKEDTTLTKVTPNNK